MNQIKKTMPFLLLTSLLLIGCTPTNATTDSSSSSLDDVTSDTTSSDVVTSTIENETSEDNITSNSEEVHFNTFNKEAVEVNIKQLLSIPKNKVDGTLYRVTGTMQYVSNTRYGNFDLTDSTGSIVVYGLSKNKNSMTGTGKNHKFSNSEDFLDLGIRGGDEVTIECVHTVYGDGGYVVPELMGYAIKAIKKNRWDITPKSYQEADSYHGSYYSSIGNETGDALGLKLHDLMMKTHTGSVSYKSLTSHFKHSDSKGGNTPYCFYTNKPASKINREHVWPQSLSRKLWGETGGGCDIHHLRAATGWVNSTRGNRKFAPMFEKEYLNTIDYANGGSNYYAAENSNVGMFEPADEIKGDVARIIAYTFVHYTNEYGGTQEQGVTGTLYLSDVLGVGRYEAKDLIRLWNAIDPVDKWEQQRNEYAFSIQHNRNPFIDHPSYMDLLFK